MKKILEVIPEVLITAGVLLIVGLVIYIYTLAGLFCLGLLLIIAGWFTAKARG